jgi:hypothetical protein
MNKVAAVDLPVGIITGCSCGAHLLVPNSIVAKARKTKGYVEIDRIKKYVNVDEGMVDKYVVICLNCNKEVTFLIE